MNALRPVLAFAVVLGLAACNANPPEACQAACAKGVQLAKAALAETIKDLPAEAQAEAQAEWKTQEAGLKASLAQCQERCSRDPNPELLGCLDAARSLQAYAGCLQ